MSEANQPGGARRRALRGCLGALVALVLAGLPASAVGQQAAGYRGMTPPSEPSSQPAATSQPARSFETVIEASPPWTQSRNFLGTRFWKLDRGHYELELWYRPEFYRGGKPSTHLVQLELELGLTQRLQLDLYENAISQVGEDGTRTFSHKGIAVELRIAIPERYGTMWGNPVVYLEFVSNHDAPDRFEGKLLLGGQLFTPRLLGAVNLVFECSVDKMRGTPYTGKPELGATAAASYEVVTDLLRLGAEARLMFESASFAALRRREVETALLLGPNVAWHVAGNRLKLYATMFFGVTDDSPRFAPWVIVATGW